MKLIRAVPPRGVLRAVVVSAAVTLGALPGTGLANAWPERPLRIIVPYASGQGADVLTRIVSEELGKLLGQPIVVENRAGAGGNIGASAAAKATADGYTFLLGTNATNAANAFLYKDPGYDAAADFESVGMIGLLPMVICTASSDFPANGIDVLIKRAQAEPDALNVGLPSTTAQVVFSEFVRSANAPLFAVKYKSSGQSITDALGGRIPLLIDTITAARPHLDSGKLRAVGVTSLKPTPMLPGVRPVSEQGVKGFDVVAWDALFAPKGTPPQAIKTMSEYLGRVLAQPAMQEKLRGVGIEPSYMPASEMERFVSSERTKWGDIIKAANIQIG